MAILILNRFPAKLVHFQEWLSELGEELYLFTTKRYSNDFPDYAYVKGFENYTENGMVEIEAERLYAERPFKAILALDESDIVRAARLRERLGLEGQHEYSALAFRDKVLMKTILKNYVPCPEFTQLDNAFKLHDFVNANGLPVVVKPRDGMGSMRTVVLRTQEDLEAYYKHGEFQNMMAETFVEGSMYSVDGLVRNGRIAFCSATSYETDGLFYQYEKGNLLRLLAPDDPLFTRLKKFVEIVLEKMPTPSLTTFHCELFRTAGDRLVFCEIASRTAGARISECIRQSYGIELDEVWSKLACDLEVEIPTTVQFRLFSASMLFPKRVGRLKAMVDELPFSWVKEYQPRAKVGQVFDQVFSSGDILASVVFEGEDNAGLLERYKILKEYFHELIVWE